MSTADCIVIGAGLAGSALVRALSKISLSSIVIDQVGIAAEASGNEVGLALSDNARSHHPEPRDTLGFRELSDSIREHESAGRKVPHGAGTVIHFPITPIQKERAKKESYDRETLSEISNSQCLSSGLLLQGIWVSPAALCRAHIDSSKSQVIIAKVSTLRFDDGIWSVLNHLGDVIATAKAVCVANATDATKLYQTAWLKLERVRGEVVHLSDSIPGLPSMPLCYDGYIVPIPTGGYIVGADYDHLSYDRRVNPGIARSLLQRLSRWVMVSANFSDRIGGRVAFRATTHDRVPYIGRVPDYDKFRLAAKPAVYSRRPVSECDRLLSCLSYHPNLYVSVGHGSRGLVSAHYGALIISEMIKGELIDKKKTSKYISLNSEISVDSRNGCEIYCGNLNPVGTPVGGISDFFDPAVEPKRLMARLMRDLRGALR